MGWRWRVPKPSWIRLPTAQPVSSCPHHATATPTREDRPLVGSPHPRAPVAGRAALPAPASPCWPSSSVAPQAPARQCCASHYLDVNRTVLVELLGRRIGLMVEESGNFRRALTLPPYLGEILSIISSLGRLLPKGRVGGPMGRMWRAEVGQPTLTTPPPAR